MSATKSDKMAALTSSLASSDVELWLDDNVDWLCDYLQRRHFTAHSAVPTRCRGPESTVNQRHSQTQTIAANEHVTVTSSTPRTASSSLHHHHQQQQQQPLVQRGVTMPDCAVPLSTNLFIMTEQTRTLKRRPVGLSSPNSSNNKATAVAETRTITRTL